MRRLIVVEYERCSLMRTELQGVSPEKRSRHIYYMEDNQLHAIIVKLSYYNLCTSMLSLKVLLIL